MENQLTKAQKAVLEMIERHYERFLERYKSIDGKIEMFEELVAKDLKEGALEKSDELRVCYLQLQKIVDDLKEQREHIGRQMKLLAEEEQKVKDGTSEYLKGLE